MLHVHVRVWQRCEKEIRKCSPAGMFNATAMRVDACISEAASEAECDIVLLWTHFDCVLT